MNRLDYYFRQKVSESELDQGFAYAETADKAIIADHGRTGVISGLTVAEQAVPNMTVQVASGVAYDPTGQRCSVAGVQNVNCAADYNAVSTAVAGGGNEKWISVHIMFARSLSDPRTDGNSLTVYFQRAESYSFKVVQGAEALAGAAVRPSIDPDGVLLCDILLAFGTTAVTNAMISTTRRMDSIVVSGSPRSIRRGLVKDALSDLLGFYNNHVTAAADKHAAADINYGGGAAWADATANPAATVEAQFDKIITDLATAGGTAKIYGSALPAWADASANAAGTLFAQLQGIINALAGTGGAVKIGAVASGGLAGGTVRSQLDALDTRTNGFLRIVSLTAGGAMGVAHVHGAAAYTLCTGSDFTFSATAGDTIVYLAHGEWWTAGATLSNLASEIVNPDTSVLASAGVLSTYDNNQNSYTMVKVETAAQTGTHTARLRSRNQPGTNNVSVLNYRSFVVVIRA